VICADGRLALAVSAPYIQLAHPVLQHIRERHRLNRIVGADHCDSAQSQPVAASMAIRRASSCVSAFACIGSAPSCAPHHIFSESGEKCERGHMHTVPDPSWCRSRHEVDKETTMGKFITLLAVVFMLATGSSIMALTGHANGARVHTAGHQAVSLLY
jgi:hypothetical protein